MSGPGGRPPAAIDDLRPFRARLGDVMAAFGPHGEREVVAVNDALRAAGFGDGLPLIPPTAALLEAMLEGRPADEAAIGAALPLSFAVPTWWELAACAVLAGCAPGVLGLVATALDAMGEPAFNLLGVQATTGAAAPLSIVHGPWVDALAINAGSNALGPGWRPNATIGRAVQLALRNVGLCWPGETDMATHGHPGKYGWLVAEYQAASPWASLSSRRGVAEDIDAVTVYGGVGNVEVVLPTTGAEHTVDLLRRVQGGAAPHGSLLLIPPESAHRLARDHWSADRLAEALATEHGAPMIVVTGGPGIKATLIPRWGGPTEAVTRTGRSTRAANPQQGMNR